MPDLRALLAAATPGPWVDTTEGYASQEDAAWAAHRSVMKRREPDIPNAEWSDLSYVLTSDRDLNVALTGNGRKSVENAALIAAAVNSLPALLDVVEAARAYVTCAGVDTFTPEADNARYDLNDALAAWKEATDGR